MNTKFLLQNMILLITTGCFFNCKAQSPILSLDNSDDFVNDAYYKDVNNELNKFVGTWVFSNGSTNFTIQLQKVEQYYNGEWSEDMLIGEYKFINNGVEIFNSLPRLESPLVNNSQHYIDGNKLLKKLQTIPCEDCDISERRVLLYFTDPERKYLSNYLVIRYLDTTNEIESIEAVLVSASSYVLPFENAPNEPRVPYGTYVLAKQ